MKLSRNAAGGTLSRSRKVLVIAAASTAALLALTGCAGSGSSGGSASKHISIAFVPKQLNNPYTDVELGGGKDAAKATGDTYSVVGPNTASASSQVSYINTLTQKHTNVIAIAANDPNAVCSALNQAKAGGAKIITFDSDTDKNCRSLFINQVNAKDVALIELKQMAEQINNEGEIAILSATANATNQNSWIQYMKQELASNPTYSKIKLVTTVYGNDDDTTSFQVAQGLLQSYPNLKGIISPTTVGIAATARYLSTSSYKGKVILTGLGLPNQMRQYVKDGTVKEFALWDPAKIGQATVYAAKALVAGTITGKSGDTFKAGSLGTLKVGADNTVIVGGPTAFDSSNIDKYNF
ncbi:rhamnose ABC transporter substrate-binding protein [Frondihabitans cladoniiphilus]|uniref:Rhamnose ABC transporter substrate-binding protein n=1 Tax=Frondihabitans cladoniiphilus TaxID=715785 RepID=A0ABP8W4F2_9MICO